MTRNAHDTREGWLAAAAQALRPYFAANGYNVPERMRFSVGFPSAGKGGVQRGEVWHSGASEDGSYEIFIRADIEDGADAIGILIKQLAHACLPPDAGHGPLFKAAANKIGLKPPLRYAEPNALLREKIQALAAELGPLPHAMLHLDRGRDGLGPINKKRQTNRHLKAACMHGDCGYTVRVTAQWVNNVGPPHCPKHGAMEVDQPEQPQPAEAPTEHLLLPPPSNNEGATE